MSSFRRFTVGVAVAVVVVLTSVAPASAHDELVSSIPVADDRLDSAPTSVSLEFSSDVMELGALIMVADESGADWVAGDPTVQLNTVTVPISEGMPVGGYEVRWRVVSADGHPISGVIPFTVGDAEPLQRQPAADATTSADNADAAAERPQDSQSTQENGGVSRVALIGAAGAATAVAVLAGIHFIRRRQTAGSTDDVTEEASSSKHSERHFL